MTNEIKAGDVVSLKGGGFIMTVEAVSEAKIASCTYFVSGDATLHRAEAHIDTLRCWERGWVRDLLAASWYRRFGSGGTMVLNEAS